MPKEAVLISLCSLGIPCQYRPSRHRRKKIDQLTQKYFLVPLCPEQLGGLPTPRVACHLEGEKVIGKDGKDYTEDYRKGAENTLRIAQTYGIKKAYLKKNSPSCGKDGITRKLLEASGIRVYQI